MLSVETKRGMRRNIRLFGVYKIFTKRVFLPLTSIYASQAAGLSIGSISLIAASASAVSLLFESATGYWADVHGRRKSAQVGAFLAGLGTAFYIIAPDFAGIMAASITIAIGYSFLSGAMEALIHDSLVVLEDESSYAKVASRAQSLSLVVNAVFIAVVPLLYPIDKRLPFVAGIIAYIILFSLASLLTEPPIIHDPSTREKNFKSTVRKILTRQTLLFFVCAGFMYSVISGITDVFNLGFIKLGLRPEQIGFVFSGASLLGALIGLQVHQLKRLSFKTYALLDVMINMGMFVAFGLIRSLPLAIAAFAINMAMWRYQKIMYQHYVLELYGKQRYKATLLSLISNFGLLHEIWLALLFGRLANHIGLLPALSYGVPMMLAFIPVFMVSISKLTASVSSGSSPSSQ